MICNELFIRKGQVSGMMSDIIYVAEFDSETPTLHFKEHVK